MRPVAERFTSLLSEAAEKKDVSVLIMNSTEAEAVKLLPIHILHCVLLISMSLTPTPRSEGSIPKP